MTTVLAVAKPFHHLGLAAPAALPHESLFVTTKVTSIPPDQTVEDSLRASLEKPQVDWVPGACTHATQGPGGRFEAGLEVRVKQKERTKSIGVSNFNKPVLRRLTIATRMAPLLSKGQIDQTRYR